MGVSTKPDVFELAPDELVAAQRVVSHRSFFEADGLEHEEFETRMAVGRSLTLLGKVGPVGPIGDPGMFCRGRLNEDEVDGLIEVATRTLDCALYSAETAREDDAVMLHNGGDDRSDPEFVDNEARAAHFDELATQARFVRAALEDAK